MRSALCALAVAITRAPRAADRKSTRLNSSHVAISYAVFCLKKKKCAVNSVMSALSKKQTYETHSIISSASSRFYFGNTIPKFFALFIFITFFFFFNDTATTEIYTLSLHDALPIADILPPKDQRMTDPRGGAMYARSEEHTSELQSRGHLVCRLLLEKKKKNE